MDIKREEWDDLLFYVIRGNKVCMCVVVCSKKANTSLGEFHVAFSTLGALLMGRPLLFVILENSV